MFSRKVPGLLRAVDVHMFPRRHMKGVLENKGSSDFEVRLENYLNRPDIDGWELRKAFCEMHGMDAVPTPPVIIAGLRACRRNNDYALAVRMLEAVKFKCGNVKKIWPYICQEIHPTLEELGVDLPEKLGYDKPELWMDDASGVW